MVLKQVIADFVGQKVVLISPSKNIPMPFKPVNLLEIEEDYFRAVDSKGIPYSVPYAAIRVLSVATTGILQIELQ